MLNYRHPNKSVQMSFEPDMTIGEIEKCSDIAMFIGEELSFVGSLRRYRFQKSKLFGHLDDGSTPNPLQFFYSVDGGELSDETIEVLKNDVSVGDSVRVTGILKESPKVGQAYELVLTAFELIDSVRERDTFQYGVVKYEKDPTIRAEKWQQRLTLIRQDSFGRPRDQLIGCIMRMRSQIKFAVMAYFIKHGFIQIDTPIITESDCEGAGEMFNVTTLDLSSIPMEDGQVDYSGDFFGKEAKLTVSGQLEAEAWAQRLGKVFTFGPTFRAEKSMTSRHLAEFWMMEPEFVLGFGSIMERYHKLLDLEESMVKYVIDHVMKCCMGELEFIEKTASPGIIDQLTEILHFDFIRMSYTEAIDMLQDAVSGGHVFETSEIVWGMDLGSEHEKYVVEQHGGPVFLMHYPQELKSFYMKADEECDEGRETCQAVDLLVPGIGELCGGSVREDDPDKLISVMEKKGVPTDQLEWYIDLRRDGGKPTGGFGLGFERFVRFITGIANIRDVIAFPRYPGHL